jgi:intracellular sulfur oxidation DsrE/DsrF family protein
MQIEQPKAAVIDDCSGLERARAVWDFTTGDARRFCDRLLLVIDSAEQFKQRKIGIDFVLLLHAAATQFAARTLSGTKFDKPGAPDISAAHGLLQRFAGMGGRIVVCRIAMDRSAIAPDNVIACAAIEHNVFVNSVALQNRGYAYMPIA